MATASKGLTRLDGKVVGVTDVSGRFSVSVRGKALLAVVPPQGWQWRGDPVEIQAADQVTTIAIALNQVESKSSVAAGSAVLGVALVGTLVLVFIGFALLTQTAATRSLERTYRQHKNLELERLQVQAVAMRKEELREALGQADGWREVLQQVLRLKSGYPEARLDLGVAYLKMGKTEEARTEFERALALDPQGEIGKQAKKYLELLK